MDIHEKRAEVANRMARSREYDGATCTSPFEELHSLVFHGCRGVSEWGEAELDEYLATHDGDGQPAGADDSFECPACGHADRIQEFERAKWPSGEIVCPKCGHECDFSDLEVAKPYDGN